MRTTAHNNSRIEAIQTYANDHGFVLALPDQCDGFTVGYPDCTEECKSWQLDRVIKTIDKFAGLKADIPDDGLMQEVADLSQIHKTTVATLGDLYDAIHGLKTSAERAILYEDLTEGAVEYGLISCVADYAAQYCKAEAELGVAYDVFIESIENPNGVSVGDRVTILGNAKDTCWEHGFIVDIEDGEALINFGSNQNPIYGMGIRKPLDQLVIRI